MLIVDLTIMSNDWTFVQTKKNNKQNAYSYFASFRLFQGFMIAAAFALIIYDYELAKSLLPPGRLSGSLLAVFAGYVSGSIVRFRQLKCARR